MSTLLPVVVVLDITKRCSTIYSQSVAAVDQANATAAALLSDLFTDLGATDPAQYGSLAQYVQGVYLAAGGGNQAISPFGLARTAGLASFNVGKGALNRGAFFNGNLFSLMEAVRKSLAQYGTGLGVTNLSSFAEYQNGIAAYTVLYDPNFAAAFWYTYNQAAQLDPQTVFAPANIILATFAVTGAGTGTLTPGAYPTANGYISPAPTTDGYGNAVYVGGLPMPQGFAPLKTAALKVTAAITGSDVVTVHAPNQAGVSEAFTATLSGAVGTVVNLVPATNGDRMYGVPTAISIGSGITAGAFEVVSLAERSY